MSAFKSFMNTWAGEFIEFSLSVGLALAGLVVAIAVWGVILIIILSISDWTWDKIKGGKWE